ncbi:Sphingosine N-acyltransferase [Purpureocillium takamizusanense]|uniref:Sphingosine N-acyltransferase n=1 Tax=Purpureocillium takamizusanense TaxID=2060973 RepID=A0A9Q8V8C1_9HYPO|nr:Sphingosine N-acyltransferase [Purpureocillium takamizusanense]UNI16940.1 Sphingosine N-acyltransferase [Purpureocillium takamizusanense]
MGIGSQPLAEAARVLVTQGRARTFSAAAAAMKPQGLATWFLVNQTRKKDLFRPPEPLPVADCRNAGIAFNLLSLLCLSHVCLPRSRPYTSQFLSLSGYNPSTGKYATASGDLCFVACCVVLLTGLRAAAIDYLLEPLGRRWGIASSKVVTRFAEQAWLVIFCGVSGPVGFWLYRSSPYYMSMTALWTDWPDRELAGPMKAYFLAQLAFWIQQIVVVNIETRRSDHWQMIGHHVVTVMLVGGSYAYHQTRVGNLIMVLMDTVELFLPLAKCLKYLQLRRACDATFVVFMLWWFAARHVLFLRICWSIYAELPRAVPPGCYAGGMNKLRGPLAVPDDWSHLFEPFYQPEGIICWYDGIRFAFLASLLFLQVLLMMWFVLIVRVAVRALQGEAVEDDREDDDYDGEKNDGQGQDEVDDRNSGNNSKDRGEHDRVVRGPAEMARQRTTSDEAE